MNRMRKECEKDNKRKRMVCLRFVVCGLLDFLWNESKSQRNKTKKVDQSSGGFFCVKQRNFASVLFLFRTFLLFFNTLFHTFASKVKSSMEDERSTLNTISERRMFGDTSASILKELLHQSDRIPSFRVCSFLSLYQIYQIYRISDLFVLSEELMV